MALTARENYLEAVKFGKPDYMPRGNEDIFHQVRLHDEMRMANWTDRWGIGWVCDMPGTVPFPKHNPIADILRHEEYVFPETDGLFVNIEDELIKMKSARAEGKLIQGGYAYFLFERVWALTGLENFLISLVETPDAASALLHRLAVFARDVFARYIDMGVDAVSFSEDLGTQRALLFSPAHFDKFFLPEYEFIFKDVIDAGIHINFHSCGCIESVADRFAGLPITVLNPVQARANDLREIKRRTMGRTALCGAVDTHLLMTGTPVEVRAETARVIEILKPGGGYICAPDQGFPNFPAENIIMLYKTAEELGKY
ncbi:MAG: hypothetical protein FWE82_00535 [Defluviitaleaceae bacterium]|nr:hypothetical protein [Defluviitaleaceae bacterium]